MEVDQQPDRQAGESEVAEQLRLIDLCDRGHSLAFNEDRVCHDEVDDLLAQIYTLERDAERYLPIDVDPANVQLRDKGSFVHLLAKTGAEVTVHLDGRGDDTGTQRVELRRHSAAGYGHSVGLEDHLHYSVTSVPSP